MATKKLSARALKAIQRTKQLNRAFEKASPAKKRVMIAEDVLAQLKAEKMSATGGTYVTLWMGDNYELTDSNEDIKQNYDKINSCSVCALGACIMSATKFANHVKFEDIKFDNALKSKRVKSLLTGIFDKKQIYLIETAFEGFNEYDYDEDKPENERIIIFAINALKVKRNSLTDEEKKACRKIYEKYIDDENGRLKAIMKNIIKNKGEFKP